MKVAIVCDWLTGIGGAERVVLELHRMFPDAPIFTSQYDPEGIGWFANADVRTTWLQKLPKALKKFLPVLRAQAFSKLDLHEYDLVISSAGAEAKAIKTSPGTVHFWYCHAPTHYYWDRYNDYLKNPGFPAGFNWLAKLVLKILVEPMRKWDFRAAQLPNYIIANSTYTQTKIKEYYGRGSVVIHPPVDTERFTNLVSTQRSGFIITGRQTPYKRIDLAVVACTQLGLPLTVVGDGPEHSKLTRLAGNTINFVTDASDRDVANYLVSAEGFILPNLDDFGIAAVEALAAGTPVIAYKAGGALDYVVPGATGEFFDEQSVESLAACLTSFKPSNYSAHDIKTAARKFNNDVFRKTLQKEIDSVLQ